MISGLYFSAKIFVLFVRIQFGSCHRWRNRFPAKPVSETFSAEVSGKNTNFVFRGPETKKIENSFILGETLVGLKVILLFNHIELARMAARTSLREIVIY